MKKDVSTKLRTITNSIKHTKKYTFPNSTLLFSLNKIALFKKSVGF